MDKHAPGAGKALFQTRPTSGLGCFLLSWPDSSEHAWGYCKRLGAANISKASSAHSVGLGCFLLSWPDSSEHAWGYCKRLGAANISKASSAHSVNLNARDTITGTCRKIVLT